MSLRFCFYICKIFNYLHIGKRGHKYVRSMHTVPHLSLLQSEMLSWNVPSLKNFWSEGYDLTTSHFNKLWYKNMNKIVFMVLFIVYITIVEPSKFKTYSSRRKEKLTGLWRRLCPHQSLHEIEVCTVYHIYN